MLGSKYAPTAADQYGSKDLNTSLQGVRFTAAPGVETVNDHLIADDHLVDGATLIALSAALGDTITCQVVDKDNNFGYGAGFVLGQYVTNWYMNPAESIQLNFKSSYPAKIYGGLYLRLKYLSVGNTAVEVIVNYTLHKVLW